MKHLYLPSLYVKGFKAIEEMNLDTLASINLIAGDNNVGKSTILEAIYAFVTNGNPGALLQMAFHRMNIKYISYDQEISQYILQFFNGWEFKGGKSITLQSVQKNLKLTLAFAYTEEIKNEDGILKKRIFKYNEEEIGNEESIKGILIQTDNEEIFFPFNRIRKSLAEEVLPVPVQFIHSSFLNKSLNSQLWDNIALSGLEKYVIEALKIIENDIDNLAFIEDPSEYPSRGGRNRVPYITLKNKSGRYPLSVMGDGMNRILSIILGLVNAKNGVCLIDEIENGIYYKRQPELWNIICHLVKELNIQLFATTHSLDCIKNFSAAATQNAQLIRLEKRKSGIKAVCYQSEELKIALENDIELR